MTISAKVEIDVKIRMLRLLALEMERQPTASQLVDAITVAEHAQHEAEILFVIDRTIKMTRDAECEACAKIAQETPVKQVCGVGRDLLMVDDGEATKQAIVDAIRTRTGPSRETE